MVATQNIDTLGPIWTFSLVRGVLTSVRYCVCIYIHTVWKLLVNLAHYV